MSRYLIVSLLSVLFFSTTVFGQMNMSMSHEGESLNNGDTIEVIGSDLTTLLDIHDFELKNNSLDTVYYRCKKVENALLNGTDVFFCWSGQCYGSQVFNSFSIAMIAPGDSAVGFVGDYDPNGVIGTSYVDFVFYNDLNNLDSVYFTAKFTIPAEASISTNSLFEEYSIYPNPCKNYLFYAKELAVVDVRDNLGQVVKIDYSVYPLDISNLSKGVYFFKFETINGKRFISKILKE